MIHEVGADGKGVFRDGGYKGRRLERSAFRLQPQLSAISYQLSARAGGSAGLWTKPESAGESARGAIGWSPGPDTADLEKNLALFQAWRT